MPIALADSVFDYRIISREDHDSLHIDVGVTVVHSKVVASYLNAFKAAGLVALQLRTEAHSIAHALIPH